LREHQLFLVLSIAIGILAGLAAVLFTLAIDRVDRVLFGLNPSMLRILAVPALASLVAGFLLAWVFTDVRGSGIPQTKASFHLHQGAIPARVPIGKFITGALCVGSGHSLGREGPSVQIGAGLASTLGRWMGLSPRRVRELVPVGAAGALAAAFNTPIAAVLFALEEIIGDMHATLLGSTVVASVASVVVERSILGNEPLFHVQPYRIVHPAELIGYAALGIIGGGVSIIFCKGLLSLRTLMRRVPAVPFHPALGGLIVGAFLLAVPEIKGVGYEYVDQALNGSLVLRTMAILCAAKLAATVISYCSGNAGGIFAPSLFIGAMAGGAVGNVIGWLAPYPHAGPGAYALVGMGALFAGIVRAPITSVFMIFEITQDYQILVPLMVANLLSFTISRNYQKVPIYDALLHQDDVHLPRPELHHSVGARSARDVMNRTVSMLNPGLSVEAAVGRLVRDNRESAIVGDGTRIDGVVTMAQLDAAASNGLATDLLSSIDLGEWSHVHPDHPLGLVIERLAETPGLLPVVSREDAARIEGVITPEDLARAARRQTRSTEVTH